MIVFLRQVVSSAAAFSLAFLAPLSGYPAKPDANARQVVERFFAAYAERDGDRLRALWSARSPEYESRLPGIVQRLEGLARIEVLSLEIREIQTREKETRVRIAAEMRGLEKSSGKPADGFGKMNRVVILAAEDDGWKVWRYYPAEDEVVDAIVATQTESERQAAATRRHDLVTPELVKAINTRGFRLSNAGEYQAAMDLHRLAEKIARQIGDTLGSIVSLKNQGDVHSERREHAQALDIYARCIAYFRENRREQDIPDVLNSMAAIQYRTGDKPGALATFREALHLAENVGDRYTVANTLNNIAIISGDLGQPEEAIKAYERSEQTYRELGDRFRAALMIHNRASQLSDMRDYAKALSLFPKALEEFRAANNRLWTGVCLRAIGNVHAKEDRLPVATHYYEESLALLDRQEDRVQLASTLFNLASMYGKLGNARRGLELLERCRELRESLGDRAGVAAALGRIAITEIGLGNFESAVRAAEKAREFYANKANVPESIRTLNVLAAAYVYQGDSAAALEALHRARAALERTESSENRVEVFNNLGAVYAGLGDRRQRDRFLHAALRLREKDGGDASGILLNIADAEIDDGRTKEGVARLRGLINRPDQAAGGDGVTAYAIRKLGDVYAGKRDYERAEEHYHRALVIAERLNDRNTVASSLLSLSQVYRKQRKHKAALQAITRAREVSESTGSRDSGIWTELGNVHLATARRDEAERAYQKAVEITEDVRARFTLGEDIQQRFFETNLDAYHGLIALNVQANKLAAAFTHLENVKARVLSDVLRGGRIPIPATLRPEEVSEERRLQAELVSFNTQLRREMERAAPNPERVKELQTGQEEARRAWDTFRTGLYAAHPEVRITRAELPPIPLAEVPAILGAESAALEYVVAADRTYLAIIGAQPGGRRGLAAQTTIVALPIGREELVRRVGEFRRQVANPNRGLPTLGRSLYDVLVRPAEAALRGKKRLIISPDGPLWDLPFQALSNSQGRHLLEDFTLSYVPSLTVLREIKSRSSQRLASGHAGNRPTPILAVGDPTIGKETERKTGMVLRGARFSRLPEAAREAQTLGQIYGAGSRVYTGAQATEARVKSEAAQASVLHFATHGVVQDASPLYSFLLLADSPNGVDDGLLEAWEILRMPLKAQVTVLSACETARGRAASGEGVIGLSWSLFLAGCPTAVLSQWEIESRSTSQMMLDFHRRLRDSLKSNSRKRTADALRSAALKIRGNPAYRHPFYWAGFVVMGDGD